MKEQKKSGHFWLFCDEGVWGLVGLNTCEKVWQDKSDDNDWYATIGSDNRRLSLQPARLVDQWIEKRLCQDLIINNLGTFYTHTHTH